MVSSSFAEKQMTGHGTHCIGLVDRVMISHKVDSMTLKYFSNLIYSAVL